jgi:YHS domain-containing protein
MGRLRTLLGLIALVVIVSAAPPAAAAEPPGLNLNADGVALEGYDPVAYFELGKPVKGSRSFSLNFEGATYLFASARHEELFKADPDRYLPAYGGYCSLGMRYGHTSRVDPTAWRVLDGRLYLQHNHGHQAVWLQKVTENIAIADRMWQKFTGALAAQ